MNFEGLGQDWFFGSQWGSNQNGDFLMNLQLVSCERCRTSTGLEHVVFTVLQVTVMALCHSVTYLDLCSNPRGYNKSIFSSVCQRSVKMKGVV